MIEEPAEIGRWRAAFAGLGEQKTAGPECPDPDRLWAAASGEAPVAERHQIIEHTAACASCATAFRLALRLSREEAREGEASGAVASLPARRSPWGQRIPLAAALAAGLLLAVVVPWRLLDRSTPQYRETPAAGLASQIAEGAVLPRDRAVLRWSAGPDGSRYDVRVLTAAGREVAVETGLTAPEVQIPPDALQGVALGEILYWQVDLLRPDGSRTASKTFSVRIE
jgi:hypothetical protein